MSIGYSLGRFGKYKLMFPWVVGNSNNNFIRVLNKGDTKKQITIQKIKLEFGVISTDWTPAPEDKQNKIDIIGGRNLLLGTKDFSGDWMYADLWTKTEETYMGCNVFSKIGGNYGPRQSITLSPGKYVFSGYAKVSESATIRMTSDITGTAKDLYKGIIGTDFQKIYTSFELSKSSSGTFTIQGDALDTDQTFYICGHKLERGEIPTDWSPAPEDLVYKSELPSELSTMQLALASLYESRSVSTASADMPAESPSIDGELSSLDQNMIKIYADLCLNPDSGKTVSDVPENLRSYVSQIVEETLAKRKEAEERYKAEMEKREEEERRKAEEEKAEAESEGEPAEGAPEQTSPEPEESEDTSPADTGNDEKEGKE